MHVVLWPRQSCRRWRCWQRRAAMLCCAALRRDRRRQQKESFTIGVRQRNPLLLGSDKGNYRRTFDAPRRAAPRCGAVSKPLPTSSNAFVLCYFDIFLFRPTYIVNVHLCVCIWAAALIIINDVHIGCSTSTYQQQLSNYVLSSPPYPGSQTTYANAVISDMVHNWAYYR